MFRILIHVANAMPAILDYKTKEMADVAYKNIYETWKENGKVFITDKDDYGVSLVIPKDKINYILLVDLLKQNENPTAQREASFRK